MASGWHRKPDTPAERARAAQYNSTEHRLQQEKNKRLQAEGRAYCWRCGKHIPPGAEMHTGHDDDDRRIYRGPECPPCNRTAAAKKGNRISNARRRQSRLEW